MAVVDSATGEIAAEGRRMHPDGFFVAEIPGRKEPFRYRLRMSSSGLTREFDDIYRFPPVLGELDLHLLAEGNHFASYRKLGAHPIVHDGIDGVAFAVWAPNAQAVSVVGDFNELGRQVRGRGVGAAAPASGRCSFPRLRPGHLTSYKYRDTRFGWRAVAAEGRPASRAGREDRRARPR